MLLTNVIVPSLINLMASRSSGSGFSPGRGHCVVSFSIRITLTVPRPPPRCIILSANANNKVMLGEGEVGGGQRLLTNTPSHMVTLRAITHNTGYDDSPDLVGNRNTHCCAMETSEKGHIDCH